jgi:hypothetical protein
MEILKYDQYDHCPFKPLHTEEWLNAFFKKNFYKMPYNRFMWWKSYTPKNKPLPNTASFEAKVKNGDFDLSPYKFEAELVEHRLRKKWFEYPDTAEFLEAARMDIARRKRLLEDHEKDENKKLADFYRAASRAFQIEYDQIDVAIDSFGGDTIVDFYNFLKKRLEDKPF